MWEVCLLVPNTYLHVALRTDCPGNTGLWASLGGGLIQHNGLAVHACYRWPWPLNRWRHYTHTSSPALGSV